MNQYTIIEDCSPYYIRFTHPGLGDIVDFCRAKIPTTKFAPGEFVHHKLALTDADQLLAMVPMHGSGGLDLRRDRASLFITAGGRYYRAHKDGVNNRISINYTVTILDQHCQTSWYSDEDLKDYPIDNLPSNTSRECQGFVKQHHHPLKTMTAQANECILFNTDIFHDFDNSQSDNTRVVLTLRCRDSGGVYFDDVKRILFGLDS